MIGIEIGQRCVVQQLVVAVARPPAEVGGRAVGSDAVQPRGELRVAAKPLQPPEGSQIRLLHHVSRILLISGEAIRERVRIGVRDAHQLLEGLVVAVASGGHQLGEITDLLWHTGPSDLAGGREVTSGYPM